MRRLPVIYGLVVLGIVTAIVAGTGPGVPELRAAIRATAFTSAVPFLLVFVASAWFRIWPSPTSRWLLTNRRWLGLSVAASHLWHLTAIIMLLSISPELRQELDPVAVAFGGAGFVLLGLMAATSTDAAQRALGRGWGWLHVTGVHVLWLDFTFTYFGRQTPFHVAVTLAFVAALGLRVAAWARRRRPAGARGALST